MGLDMYLQKKIYIGANFEHNKIAGAIDLSNNKGPIKIDLKKVTYIIEEAGYWRKANAIHKWFVDNVQDGKDDCGTYYVSYEQLLELKALCKKVIKIKNAELLPPESGFFFGSTDVDEYYFNDLKETIKLINKLDPDSSYEYHSSW